MLAWDTETALMRPAVLAPELACLAFGDTERSEIVSGWDAKPYFEWLLQQETTTANGAFDCAVAWSWFPELGPLIWDAILKGRVHDVIIRQKLIDIGEGKYRFFGKKVDGKLKYFPKYNLSSLVERYFDYPLDKDEWRLRYGPLRFIPIQMWERGAREYPKQDARHTARVHVAQDYKHSWMRRHPMHYLHNEAAQVAADWVLTLMGMHGVATDDAQVSRVIEAIDTEQPKLKEVLTAAGLVARDGTRKVKKAQKLMWEVVGESGELTDKGFELVKTEKMTRAAALEAGYIKLDEESCANSENEYLKAYGTYYLNQLNRAKFVRFKTGPLPLHTSFEVMLETGRTSSSAHKIIFNSAALQNLPRKKGLRECVVSRPGTTFVASDFGIAELVSLAQVTYNWFEKNRSPGDRWYVKCRLRETLNQGKDPHLDVGATFMGISYEEIKRRYDEGDKEAKSARQRAKVLNFGFPGGLSVNSLIAYARKSYGVTLTKQEAARLVRQWLQKYPEMKLYFKFIRKMFDKRTTEDIIDDSDTDQLKRFKFVSIQQEVSGRIRGKCRYTQACNSFFQGLTADAAKAALVEVSRRCYTVPTSALYGSRPVLYVHDEIVLETPDEMVSAAAKELEEVMVAMYSRFTPDVKITADAHAMKRWTKDAKAVRENGQLLPFVDEKFEEELEAWKQAA